MTVVNHVLNRIHVQRLLLAATLFGVSLSASANFIARTTHGNFEIVRVGKTTELRPPQTVMGNGNAVASTGTVTQGMGATAGGSTAASGVNLGGTATVPVNGSNVPVAVKTNVGSDVLIPAAISALGCAKGGVAGAVICAGATVAAPFALEWLTRAGGRINPATRQLERTDTSVCTVAPCIEYKVELDQRTGYFSTRDAACTSWFNTQTQAQLVGNTAMYVAREPHVVNPLQIGFPICSYNTYYQSGALFAEQQSSSRGFLQRNYNPQPTVWLPSSMDDIAPYMNKVPVDPGIVKEVTDAGQDLGNPPLQVSGPTSVPGQSVTNITNNVTNNTTTTTTTTTTNNYKYEGNKVTDTGSGKIFQTTTTTKNPDGTSTTTTTETGTETRSPNDPAEPEPQKTQCDKYPNTLGCAEMDVPDGEIPKDTKNVNFSAEDPFGGGRCPADVMASFRAIGNQSLKIVDWTTFCGMALPLRGLVLALASIMAFFIIMPGGVRE